MGITLNLDRPMFKVYLGFDILDMKWYKVLLLAIKIEKWKWDKPGKEILNPLFLLSLIINK